MRATRQVGSQSRDDDLGSRPSLISRRRDTKQIAVILRERIDPSLTGVDDDVDEVHALGEGVSQVDVMEGHDAALPLGPLKGLPPFDGLLPSHLVFVEFGEVVDDNGNGQRDYQDTTYTTHTADHLAERGRGVDVAVSDGGHCDACPPKGLWNAYEFGPGLLLLSEVGETREYKDTHRQEEHQQAQLFVRVTQGKAKAL